MKLTTLSVFAALLLGSFGAMARDVDRMFLLCDGVSLNSSGDAFSFTVTLDLANGKVLSIGSGGGAVTEIIGKQDVSDGVTNRLRLDRTARTFSLAIYLGKAGTDSDATTDDEFRGTCSPTSKAF